MLKDHLSQIACLAAIACSTFTLTVCSGSDIAFYFKSEEAQYAILYDSPGFWDNASPVSSANGLYQIDNVAFEGKPYNSMARFGNKILMIGQGSYSSDLVQSITKTEPEYEYSFEVYDPWRNKISASLSHEDIVCDSYQVLADRLFLYNSADACINIYDTDLKLTDTIACSTDDVITYYSGYNSKLILYIDDGGNLVSMSADDFSTSQTALPLYEPQLLDVSTNGNYYLTYGVNKDTLQNEAAVYSTAGNDFITYIQGDDFSSYDLAESSLVSRIDSDNNIWVYHTFDGDDTFFSQEEIQAAQIIADDKVLLHAEKSIFTDSDNHSNYYYLYSPDNGVVSSFGYSCGTYGNNDYQIFSPDCVYMEQNNCAFFLVYTADCMPKLLVWNIDEAKNDTGVKIKSYSNITDVQNAVAAGTANSLDRARAIVTEYPDDFGHDVTKVKNTDIYDWGDLTALNDRATELEEKYNIEIYMGAEVPDSLDYYNLKQNDDVSTLSEALGSLEQIFDCYPRDFFTQLCFGTNEGIRLYITGDISGNNNGTISEASGFVTNINSHIVIVLDANYCWNWDYTVNHEIAHLIDRRLEFLSQYKDDIVFSEKKWDTYNPDDFTYLESYDNYENNPDYGKYSQYFIDPYGTTYATEDRAELFGTVMNNALSGITDDSQFAPDTVLYDKMKYYCDCIRDGFSTEGWADTLPWELMFK